MQVDSNVINTEDKVNIDSEVTDNEIGNNTNWAADYGVVDINMEECDKVKSRADVGGEKDTMNSEIEKCNYELNNDLNESIFEFKDTLNYHIFNRKGLTKDLLMIGLSSMYRRGMYPNTYL